MIRKEVLFLIVIVGVLFYSFSVLAQVVDDNEEIKDDAERILDATNELREFTEEKKWEYLSEQWKILLLKNNIIRGIDKFFNSINFVFVFLFGEDYDLSLTLFFSIILWIFFLVIFGRIISNFSSLSDPIAWIVGFVLAIILAHLRVYDFLSEFLFKIIFFKEGIWGWISFLIFFVIYFVVLIYLERIIWKIGRWKLKSEEEKEEWDRNFRFKIMDKKIESMGKVFVEVGGKE